LCTWKSWKWILFSSNRLMRNHKTSHANLKIGPRWWGAGVLSIMCAVHSTSLILTKFEQQG
jgi:hypothetical protein